MKGFVVDCHYMCFTLQWEDVLNSNLYGTLIEFRSKSGNWPHSCGAPVWGVALWLCLCCRVCVLLLRKPMAICLQFECSSRSHVTNTFVLFSRCTTAFYVSHGKLWSCTQAFRWHIMFLIFNSLRSLVWLNLALQSAQNKKGISEEEKLQLSYCKHIFLGISLTSLFCSSDNENCCAKFHQKRKMNNPFCHISQLTKMWLTKV